jgi:hypothetical protein
MSKFNYFLRKKRYFPGNMGKLPEFPIFSGKYGKVAGISGEMTIRLLKFDKCCLFKELVP